MAMQFLIAVFHCLYTSIENILIVGIHLKSISSFLCQGKHTEKKFNRIFKFHHIRIAFANIIAITAGVAFPGVFLFYLLPSLVFSAESILGVEGSANDLSLYVNILGCNPLNWSYIDRTKITHYSGWLLQPPHGRWRLILTNLYWLNMTQDLSIRIWWNLKIRLNFFSVCYPWYRKLEMLLRCIPMMRMFSAKV